MKFTARANSTSLTFLSGAMISDIVLERPLPPAVADSIDALIGCVGGASLRGEYLATIAAAGFREVKVQREASFATAFDLEDPRLREALEIR